jgi:hypothetical protein
MIGREGITTSQYSYQNPNVTSGKDHIAKLILFKDESMEFLKFRDKA